MKKISYSLVFNRKKKLNKKGMNGIGTSRSLLKQEKNVLLNQGVPQTRPVGRKT